MKKLSFLEASPIPNSEQTKKCWKNNNQKKVKWPHIIKEKGNKSHQESTVMTQSKKAKKEMEQMDLKMGQNHHISVMIYMLWKLDKSCEEGKI